MHSCGSNQGCTVCAEGVGYSQFASRLSELGTENKRLAGEMEELLKDRYLKLAENARLKEELAALRSESCEWLCESCQVIHPQQEKGFVQPCPKCKATMMPTSQNRRKIAALEAKLKAMEAKA